MMNVRIRLAMLRLSDPRLVRLALIVLMLVLSLVVQAFPAAEPVFACPSGTGGGGCDGGT
jgi:hypothetical protein